MRNRRRVQRTTTPTILGSVAVKAFRQIAQLAIGAARAAETHPAGFARRNCQRAREVRAQCYCPFDR